ncbi:MAG: hypothetical protein ACSHX0_05405 [Akkermansiaceae bacterium]
MKKYRLILLLLATALTVASASESKIATQFDAPKIDTNAFVVSDIWKLDKPVYAQIKAVPSHQAPPKITTQKWGGLWEPYREFRVAIGYAKGESISPTKYHFVSPRISIRGAAANSASGHSKTVNLFNRQSSQEDIEVRMLKLPDMIKIDQEYEVAYISGKEASAAWTIYVRFLSEVPNNTESKKPNKIR